MNRKHAFVLSLLVGVLVVAGTLAATGTVRLGGSSQAASVSDAEIAAQQAKLDRYEASLKKALKRKPPKLPPLEQTGTTRPAAAAAQPKVVYVRAESTAAGTGGGEYEHETGDEHGGSEGGELDD